MSVSAKSRSSKREEEKANKRKRTDIEENDGHVEAEGRQKKHKSVLSKFERSAKIAQAVREAAAAAPSEEPEEQPELHDLGPLPQPPKARQPLYNPNFSALPPWLTAPLTISSNSTTPFEDLGIDPKLVAQLKKKGYEKAFAVQAACLPLLLPGDRRHLGDVCVSAATGSGKTLAYVLPLVESLKGLAVTKLRGLIVVPTRELVSQARDIAEQCVAGSGLKVGTAVGNHSFSAEHGLLVKRGAIWNPEVSAALQDKARKQAASGRVETDPYLNDAVDTLPHHVPEYESKVDILICTPGRLVEHIRSTMGFSLRDVQWLVIDEADRLLDQSFQEWVEVLMGSLEAQTPQDQRSSREKILEALNLPPEKKKITKVILSATMTRDLGKLASLKLRRPKLVIVESDDTAEQTTERQYTLGSGETFELPSSLKEWAISVGDGADKPLYLLQLLQDRIMVGGQERPEAKDLVEASSDSDPETSSESGSSDSSESSSDSDSSSETDSSSESSSSDEDISEDESSHSASVTREKKRTSPARGTKNNSNIPRVLIFTSNNENASRLAYLLGTLHPPYKHMIGSLTKSSATSAGRKMLAAFRSGKINILIASDRASRGLDVPELSHVVNYDIPHGVTSYVHRVGRTARAGKQGTAWTFVTRPEARWFWNSVARAPEIKRGERQVERLNIPSSSLSEGSRKAYEAALKDLQKAVEGKDKTR